MTNMIGSRRLVAYLVAILGVFTVEIVNKFSGGGISANAQIALLGVSAVHFGGIAFDKVQKSKSGVDEK